MKSGVDRFEEIAAGVGVGAPPPPDWTPVRACKCLVLVGLTGVGKSTVLANLADTLPGVTVLPDRRTLTDLLMIPFVQRQDGLVVEPVADRTERFDLTRRYRQLFPGGMAHALGTLSVSPDIAAGSLVFDGLRGANEVQSAAESLPLARFLMLDAPDLVRITRLAARSDSFDHVNVPVATADAAAASLTAAGVPELADILTDDEQRQAARMLAEGEINADDFAAKARIVIAERRNYDPDATRRALRAAAPGRSLIVDTSTMSPHAVARSAIDWFAG